MANPIKRWLLLLAGVTATLVAALALADEGPRLASVSVSGTSARTSADLGPGWKAVYCTVAVHFRTGTSTVTAATTDMLIPATTSRPVYISGTVEQRIAFITDGGSGTCSIYNLQVGPNGVPPDVLTVNGADISPASITVSGGATVGGALTVSGDASVGGNLATSGSVSGASGDFGQGDVVAATVSFSGGGAPCLTRGGNTTVQTCSGDGFASLGTLQGQASADIWGGIKNTANGANCTGATDDVCFEEDVAGSTGGTTGWTISGAGVAVFNTSARIAFTTLGTCAAGVEGALRLDATSGVATGKATQLCMCRSDGASTYTWINVITGTNGTATTCLA